MHTVSTAHRKRVGQAYKVYPSMTAKLEALTGNDSAGTRAMCAPEGKLALELIVEVPVEQSGSGPVDQCRTPTAGAYILHPPQQYHISPGPITFSTPGG